MFYWFYASFSLMSKLKSHKYLMHNKLIYILGLQWYYVIIGLPIILGEGYLTTVPAVYVTAIYRH